MNKKAKQKKQPTTEEIQNKAASFIDKLKKVATKEISLDAKKDTLISKLELIKDGLLLLKDKKIPYTTLSKLIEDDLGLKVSSQTLRAYCQNHLGFEKQKRAKKTNNDKDNNKGIFKDGINDNKSIANDLAADNESFN